LANYLISLYSGISPHIYSWSAQNTAGDTKRKATTGMLFVGASAGNIIGPQLFKSANAPHYATGLHVNLALFICIAILAVVGALNVRRLNIRHAHMREAMGKSAVVVDLSMESKRQLKERGAAANEIEGEASIGEHGFDDMGDLKNEDFTYVY